MKKLGALLVITMLLLSTTSFVAGNSANQNEVKYKEYVEKLKELQVFKGTSTGFELDREPTRLEAAVMFVRLLGAEEEAKKKNYGHPLFL